VRGERGDRPKKKKRKRDRENPKVDNATTKAHGREHDERSGGDWDNQIVISRRSRHHTERRRVKHGRRTGSLHRVSEEPRIVPAVVARLRDIDAAEAKLDEHVAPIMRIKLGDTLLRGGLLRILVVRHRLERIPDAVGRRDEWMTVVVRGGVGKVAIAGHARGMEGMPVAHSAPG